MPEKKGPEQSFSENWDKLLEQGSEPAGEDKMEILKKELDTGGKRREMLEEAVAKLQKERERLDGLFGEVGVEESEDKFEQLCEEFAKDFKTGEAGYQIITKIPRGESFMGYEEKSMGEGYVEFCALSDEKKVGDARSRLREFNESQKRKKFLLDQATNRSQGDVPVEYWAPKGDVRIYIMPLKTKNQNGSERQVRLNEYEPSSNREDDLCVVNIQYALDASSLSGAVKKRDRESTTISFILRKDLAERILIEFEGEPKKLWKFIESIEPKLLELSPPRGKSMHDKTGLVVCKKRGQKIESEVLSWDKKDK